MFAAHNRVDTKTQRVGLAAAVSLHVVAIAALLSYTPVREALVEAAPIIVSLITPPPPVDKPIELPKPLPIKPTAKPAPQPPVEAAPLVAIAPTAPAAIETPARDVPVPLPPIQEAPPAKAESGPPPIVAPSFNAAYLDNPPPPYPAIAKRAGEQGKVILRVLVTAGGTAETVELKTSSGSQRLDHAALETVKRWRFVAARQGDRAVAAWVLVPINFTLEN